MKAQALVDWDGDSWVVEVYEFGTYSPPSIRAISKQEADDIAANFNLKEISRRTP